MNSGRVVAGATFTLATADSSIFVLDNFIASHLAYLALRSFSPQHGGIHSGLDLPFGPSTELSSSVLVPVEPCTYPLGDGYHEEGNPFPVHGVYVCNHACSGFGIELAGMPLFCLQKIYFCWHSAHVFCGQSLDFHCCHRCHFADRKIFSAASSLSKKSIRSSMGLIDTSNLCL